MVFEELIEGGEERMELVRVEQEDEDASPESDDDETSPDAEDEDDY
jgi:hypothetical protein